VAGVVKTKSPLDPLDGAVKGKILRGGLNPVGDTNYDAIHEALRRIGKISRQMMRSADADNLVKAIGPKNETSAQVLVGNVSDPEDPRRIAIVSI
jgi:hypothetical protein